jgi:formylmethanofuran dehydrogenase subunit E
VGKDLKYALKINKGMTMGWFHQVKNPKLKNIKKAPSNTPVGLWKKCNRCGEILQAEKLEENLSVCPLCDYPVMEDWPCKDAESHVPCYRK